MKWGTYAELTPEALAAIRTLAPVAYLPWGSLEWHGPHLPFGVDGLIAQAVAERVAQRIGGVLLPPTWWPAAAVPHPDSLSIPSSAMHRLWGTLFGRLAEAGWNVVVVLSGSTTPGHELVLIDAAEVAINQYGLLVLALPPLAIVDETMVDHAALWETSVMLALYPDLVNLEALGPHPLTPANSAVLGRDPRGTASASLGKQALAMAVEQISRAIRRLLTERSATPLYTLYAHRRNCLRAYTERYGEEHPDDATRAWWEHLCREADGGAEAEAEAEEVGTGEPEPEHHDPERPEAEE